MMDAQVDNRLGDSIIYKVNGTPVERAPGDPTIPGFLILFGDDGGVIADVRPQIERWRLKVHKRFVPAGGPSMRHTVDSPKLDSITHRPTASNADSDGDYWYVDLQKAPL
jgi:hypothetical protein